MQSETLSTLFHGHFEVPAGITYGQMSDMNENLTNGVICETTAHNAAMLNDIYVICNCECCECAWKRLKYEMTVEFLFNFIFVLSQCDVFCVLFSSLQPNETTEN